MAGLDPTFHLPKTMDARVKPAHDEGAYAAGLIRTYTSRGLAA